jgi:uncharacterized membrane protein YfcA
MELLTLLLAGAVAGLVAGLLGIGGGVIIVPVLSLVFVRQGGDPEIIIKVAVGTSLATIMVTAVSSIWAHHQHGAVRWPLFRIMSPGVVIGSLIGAWIADLLPGLWLTVAFILFLIGVSLQMAWGQVAGHREMPGLWAMRGVSTIVGAISALMGIGGGTLHVPYLSRHSIPVKHAIATASALGLPLAVASTAGFVLTGLNETGRPEQSLGYVNLPAFAGVVGASILFAPLGARLAHRLPDRLLKRVFALFLFILALRMTYDLII